MSHLTDALDRLVELHRSIGSPVPDYLRPGAHSDVVRSTIEGVGLEAPDELVELFGWHDGIDDEAWRRDGAGTGFARLFGDAHFAPVADAAAEYHESIRIDADAAAQALPGVEIPPTWSPTWFPAFCGGWETYAVECQRDAGIRGAVFDVNWHPGPVDEPVQPRFRSLTSMIDAIVRRFDQGAYSWDPSLRFLQQRDDVLERLTAEEQREVT